MSTLQCPLCGLRFQHSTELEVHARDDHAPQRLQRLAHLAPPRPREDSDRAAYEHEQQVLRLPW